MPQVMMAIEPMEIVITPGATYFVFERLNSLRRIYTDGRRFPDDIDPSFTGYSVGQWQDNDGHGRFDTLVIETRAIKGPHTHDASGIPFHKSRLMPFVRCWPPSTDRSAPPTAALLPHRRKLAPRATS
jgi:hypothetical protein